MSWRVIAARDVRDASRSKAIWLLIVALVVPFVGFAAAHALESEATFASFVDGLAELVAAFLPLVAVLLAYKSVVHERIDGALTLTLSLPHSRRDLVVGKVLGRTIVLLVPALASLAVAGVLGAAFFGTEGALRYPWFLLVTALYGAAFVAVAVGLSLSTAVERRVTVGALGGYLLLVHLWTDLHLAALVVLHRFDTGIQYAIPDWALLVRLATPSEAYYRLIRAGFDVDRAGRYVADGAPHYVDWWMGILVLLAWIVVPLAVGFRRFRRSDL